MGGLGGLIGAAGGLSAFVAWRRFKHQHPIESQDAVFQSFERQIASAENRGDKEEVERLQKELEQQEEAWRAQQGVRLRTPRRLKPDKKSPLAGEEAAALRNQLEKAQTLLSATSEDYLSRGYAHFELGEYEQALAALDRAIDLSPDDPQAHYNRGHILRRLNRAREELKAYDRAIELRPDHADSHSSRGDCLSRLSRDDEALVAFDRAVGLAPDSADAHYNRGTALIHLGRYEQALTALVQCLRIQPDHPDVAYNMACASSLLQRGEEALRWLQRAIAVDPKVRHDARADTEGFAYLRDHPEYGPRFRELVGEGEKGEEPESPDEERC